jgi:mRNA interferase HigB
MLRILWESSPKYRDAQKQMTEWNNYCENAQWGSPHELNADLRNASILKNNRVVFNICGNKYRIVVLMRSGVQNVILKKGMSLMF